MKKRAIEDAKWGSFCKKMLKKVFYMSFPKLSVYST